jgi:hypothetical protein
VTRVTDKSMPFIQTKIGAEHQGRTVPTRR